ncbi:hypothetical protein [Desulfurispira natronophila]|uniref:Uncharacterized protein n=1 Tax=Desulfurispira natronophila TaxID=682562 RepID=A0A7W7Y5L6_9BACT|nr:hypothetical protein [Desulfurispira natronophila]MBB5022344.1 hypothetical protein [Desulfurispira natronophila]
MNIWFEYLYRDAGNNKIWGEVVFCNTKTFSTEELETLIRSSLIDGEFFDPDGLGLPELQFDSWDSELDHGWYEYNCVATTDNAPTDEKGRDIGDFITDLQASTKIVNQIIKRE